MLMAACVPLQSFIENINTSVGSPLIRAGVSASRVFKARARALQCVAVLAQGVDVTVYAADLHTALQLILPMLEASVAAHWRDRDTIEEARFTLCLAVTRAAGTLGLEFNSYLPSVVRLLTAMAGMPVIVLATVDDTNPLDDESDAAADSGAVDVSVAGDAGSEGTLVVHRDGSTVCIDATSIAPIRQALWALSELLEDATTEALLPFVGEIWAAAFKVLTGVAFDGLGRPRRMTAQALVNCLRRVAGSISAAEVKTARQLQRMTGPDLAVTSSAICFLRQLHDAGVAIIDNICCTTSPVVQLKLLDLLYAAVQNTTDIELYNRSDFESTVADDESHIQLLDQSVDIFIRRTIAICSAAIERRAALVAASGSTMHAADKNSLEREYDAHAKVCFNVHL